MLKAKNYCLGKKRQGSARKLESRRWGAATERLRAGKYKELIAGGELLVPFVSLWAGLGGVIIWGSLEYMFRHEEPETIPALIFYAVMAFHAVGSCFGLYNLYKQGGRLGEADRIFGVEPDINLDDKKAPSVYFANRALGKTRTMGKVNQSFVEPTVHVECETAPLLNDHPFSIELTEIKITRPASKASVSLV